MRITAANIKGGLPNKDGRICLISLLCCALLPISLSVKQVLNAKPVRNDCKLPTIMKRNKQIDIKCALALSSTFSFLCCCARACLLPFLTLYFRQLGLTPAMTGAVMGTKHLITLVWSPMASLLAKHYNKRRAVITCSLACSAAVALVMLLIPPVNVQTWTRTCNVSDPSGRQGPNLLTGSAGPATLVPQSGVTIPESTTPDIMPTPAAVSVSFSQSKSSPQQKNASVVVSGGHGEPTFATNRVTDSVVTPVKKKRSEFKSGSEEELGEETTEEEGKDEGSFDFLGSLKAMDSQHQLFFLTLITVAGWEFASAPLEWTADDGLYEYLDYADASDHYTSNGVWSLLGKACGVGGVGLLVSQLSCLVAGRTPRSAVHFFCYAGVAALALPAAMYLPLYLNKKRNRANGHLKAAQLVRGSPRALLCAVSTLLVGVAGSAVDDFLLWQMQDHGSSELHMGLSLALAQLSQACFPLLAGRVSKLLRPGRVLAVGAACLGLQCLYYSFLWGPWAALPAQALSFFSSGALSWAVKNQCEDVATPGAERSVRRVYSALSLHLGGGLGSIAGGLVAQRFGLTWLFRGIAAGLILWCTCLPLLQWNSPRQRRINYSRLLAADASEASDSDSDQERDWLDKALEDHGSSNHDGRRINH